ncbi:MAG: hypothetical protein JXQ84_00320 [Rhodospirillaceae bacterium]|nr:hypothetical protein [Rhodospirillaceae bacterium]
MFFRSWLSGCVVSTVFAVSMAMALAQSEVTALGRFGDWASYSYSENGRPVCYAASAPVKSRGKIGKRGEVFFLVTHRPEFDDIGVVTVVSGYAFKDDSHATVKIGGTSFRFFTRDETAWANGADDKAVVRAMKRGKTMLVKGRNRSGTLTTDLYSLLGFTKAHQAISKACGVSAR